MDNGKINGVEANPLLAYSLAPGLNGFASISWSDSTLTEKNITAFDQIEFRFVAYDDDNWSAGNFVDQIVTLAP